MKKRKNGRYGEVVRGNWVIVYNLQELPLNRRFRSFMAQEEDTTIYRVVMNHEEQYSLWPAEREDAPGWKDVGKSGTKAECLAYIKEVWTDMRPLSVRKRMQSATATRT